MSFLISLNWNFQRHSSSGIAYLFCMPLCLALSKHMFYLDALRQMWPFMLSAYQHSSSAYLYIDAFYALFDCICSDLQVLIMFIHCCACCVAEVSKFSDLSGFCNYVCTGQDER